MRGDRERLLDILEAIEKIRIRTTITQAEFIEDELIQVWCVHHIQIIGEAAAEAHLRESSKALLGKEGIMFPEFSGKEHELKWRESTVAMTQGRVTTEMGESNPCEKP